MIKPVNDLLGICLDIFEFGWQHMGFYPFDHEKRRGYLCRYKDTYERYCRGGTRDQP
jgi:hypothetical protein